MSWEAFMVGPVMDPRWALKKVRSLKVPFHFQENTRFVTGPAVYLFRLELSRQNPKSSKNIRAYLSFSDFEVQ